MSTRQIVVNPAATPVAPGRRRGAHHARQRGVQFAATPDRATKSASNLDITSVIVYLEGIDNAEIIGAVHARRAPMIPVTGSLRF